MRAAMWTVAPGPAAEASWEPAGPCNSGLAAAADPRHTGWPWSRSGMGHDRVGPAGQRLAGRAGPATDGKLRCDPLVGFLGAPLLWPMRRPEPDCTALLRLA